MKPLSKLKLVKQLKDLGLAQQATSPLMIHASLREVGPIEGSAEGLLDAIVEALGPKGTLLMVLGADEAVPFDALTSPAHQDMGILAEVFRQRKGVKVNDHAAARFAALGPLADHLLYPIPLHDYYGSGSVLEKFSQARGWVLRLGADVDTVTLTHWAEYLADLPYKRRVRLAYQRADIGEQWIESLDDTYGIVEWSEGDYFAQIWLDYLAQGQVKLAAVGNCQAELFAAQSFVTFAVRWLETQIAS
ncbi:MAG: AAC(3) family N-acetyltransferase [Deinococcales bacterium]